MRRLAFALCFVSCASCDRCHGPPPKPKPAPAPASAHVAARPRVRPSLLWSTAVAHNTPQAWDAAAAAYASERKTCTDDCVDRAFAVVLARRNALAAAQLAPPQGEDKPPLPPQVRALVDAVDDYVAIAPPDDPTVVENKFVAASALYRWHSDEALERFEELLRIHRYDELAEYAANMLLDQLIRTNNIEQMKYWVYELLGDARFMAGKDELRRTLEALRERIESP